jgi:uncharacterized membrane protein (DUF485 family)
MPGPACGKGDRAIRVAQFRQIRPQFRNGGCRVGYNAPRGPEMFITLLVVTFLIAATCSFIVARLFDRPVRAILNRIVADELGSAWHRYVTFAIYVVGISGGVRIWELEKYITPRGRDDPALVLNTDRWVLEVYRTIIETLQAIAWMLLVVFLVALVAFVIVRAFELRAGRKGTTDAGPA